MDPTPTPANADSPSLTEQFVRLYASQELRIYSYILALLPEATAADEVLQETSVALWRMFGEFQPGTNFLAWARKIAYYRVLEFRKKQGRDRHVFSDAFLEQVATDANRSAEDFDDRRQALSKCVEALRPTDRELISMRYGGGFSVRQCADQLKRPLKSVYASLNRIHRALLGCIGRKTAADEA